MLQNTNPYTTSRLVLLAFGAACLFEAGCTRTSQEESRMRTEPVAKSGFETPEPPSATPGIVQAVRPTPRPAEATTGEQGAGEEGAGEKGAGEKGTGDKGTGEKGAGEPRAPTAICQGICQRTKALGCGSVAECLSACAKVNDGSICAEEMSAFMDCALTHPAKHWECTDNGVAAIRNGYCDTQQLAFIRCAQATVR